MEGEETMETNQQSTSLASVILETETSGAVVQEDASAAVVSTISTGEVFPPTMLAGASGGDAAPERKEFESICLEEKKKPRRIIHFSDGVLEEYSTDEEDGEEGRELLEQPQVDPKTLDWLPFIWHYIMKTSVTTYRACDFMGEKLAYFFGITSPKYAYALSEYNRLEEEEKDELNRQISEREEHRDRVARQEAEKILQESLKGQPEPGLPTSTH